MPTSYEIDLPDIGVVKVSKKSGMRSLRMRLSANGQIMVSVPSLTPKYLVERFIKDRQDWILKNRPKSSNQIYRNGCQTLSGIQIFISVGSGRNSSRLLSNKIYFKLNQKYSINSQTCQNYIESKVTEAMKTQAENVLLPRLLELSIRFNHRFNQAHVKKVYSRWGSCDSAQNINLNIYLVQLPQILQDYVIIHELAHTKHMNHGNAFWSDVSEMMPSYKLYRKMLKNYHPTILLNPLP